MDKPVEVIDIELIREQIREFIQENFLFDGDISQLDDDSSFIEQGIVDPTGVLELVLFAEETYGIAVDQADLLPENFDSVNSLAAYVALQLARE
jgi:acyl carrier protein